VCGVTPGMFMFGLGLEMPNPGPILSDQCRMLASLFMAKESWGALRSGSVEERWLVRVGVVDVVVCSFFSLWLSLSLVARDMAE